jgi:hypothetical protein
MTQSLYARKCLALLLCIVLPATQYACTKYTRHTIDGSQLTDKRERSVEVDGKIIGLVLKTGERFAFDKSGGLFCDRKRSICGTTRSGESVTFAVEDIDHIILRHVSEGRSALIVALVLLSIGAFIAVLSGMASR